ncbi:MAG: PIG-L deacetylase family protein [Candidatus Hydrogenedentota bacterium]
MRKKTVLIVVAHADDMEFMAGGIVARFAQECGYAVYEYILTDNRRGSYRLDVDELVATSAREAVAAGRILGLEEVRLEGYPDGMLNEEAPNVLRDKVMAMIRAVRADIVMSWDPFAPYEDHPDHRMAAMATLDAAAFAGNPKFHPEHAHAPYPPTEAYWFAKSPVDAACVVDIATTIDTKIAALLAHDCQLLFTADMLKLEAQTLGITVPVLEHPEKNYRQLIEAGVRQWCAETGEPAGYAYGERFRYQKISALDTMLGMDTVQPDFH